MHSAQFGFVAIIPRTVPVWSLEDSTLCKSCFEQYASLSLWGSSTSSSARSTPGRAEGPSAKAPARAAFVCAWACEAPADLSDLTGPCCRADGECAERRCERRLALAPAAWQTWTAPPGPPPTRACHKRLQRRAWATAGLQKRQEREAHPKLQVLAPKLVTFRLGNGLAGAENCGHQEQPPTHWELV